MRAVGLALVFALAACGSNGADETACQQALADAAAIEATEDAVENLDEAIRVCASLVDFEAAADAFPEALDGASAREFIANRCSANDELADTALCQEVAGD
jgi:hypothetical protein